MRKTLALSLGALLVALSIPTLAQAEGLVRYTILRPVVPDHEEGDQSCAAREPV